MNTIFEFKILDVFLLILIVRAKSSGISFPKNLSIYP